MCSGGLIAEQRDNTGRQSGVLLPGLQHQKHVGWTMNSHGLQKENQQCWALLDELNTFHERFENNPAEEVEKAQDPAPTGNIYRADVRRYFKRINPRKVPGPDGIPGWTLKVCADQLADVFTDIFNLSLLQSVVLTCFKKTTIVPVPKTFITSSLPDSLDPLQDQTTDDAIALNPPHCPLPTWSRGTHMWEFFSLTIVQHSKPLCPPSSSPSIDLGLNTALCDWTLNFLMDRLQAPPHLTLNTSAPQCSMFSLLLYSLFKNDTYVCVVCICIYVCVCITGSH